MKDAIIAEVWRNRDTLAKRYGYNLDVIVAAMKKRQRHPLTPLAKETAPNKRIQRITRRVSAGA
jgi:hypothetical protein